MRRGRNTPEPDFIGDSLRAAAWRVHGLTPPVLNAYMVRTTHDADRPYFSMVLTDLCAPEVHGSGQPIKQHAAAEFDFSVYRHLQRDPDPHDTDALMYCDTPPVIQLQFQGTTESGAVAMLAQMRDAALSGLLWPTSAQLGCWTILLAHALQQSAGRREQIVREVFSPN